MPYLTNLRNLLKERGKSEELSKNTGISSGNISDWKSGRSKPALESLIKIANHFDCSVDYLLDRTDVREVNHKSSILPTIIYRIPVYQQDVAAGSGQLGFDQKHEIEEFTEINMPKKISYGIKIKGNSMETDDEKNIPSGRTALVTTEFDYDELVGEAVVVNINGTLVCKEYNIAEDGHLWLKSRNESKSNEDRHLYTMDGVKIIGRVVKVIWL